MNDYSILIPAAGASRRMDGVDKLLEPVFGTPILRYVALRAIETGAQVLVSLPALDHPRAAAISDLPLICLPVPDAAEGMSASLRRGAAHLASETKALMILPADMPDITCEDMTWLFSHAKDQNLVQATADDGTPGHPVVFPSDCIAGFADLDGDEGAKRILRANTHRVTRVPLRGTRATTDLDTPEAWLQWRLKNPA